MSLSHIMAEAPCCKRRCLRSILSHKKAAELVYNCRAATNDMTQLQRSEYFHNLIVSCVDGQHDGSGYVRMRFRVGVTSNEQLPGVCKACFCNCYGVSTSTIDRAVRNYKDGAVVHAPVLNDKTSISDAVYSGFKKAAAYFGIKLSRQQLAAARIPNSVVAVSAYAWMARYFSLVGDDMSNCDEIHLEPTWIKDVWQEYVDDMKMHSNPYLSDTDFGQLWIKCFPHVKIREFKAVSGKCETCMKLSKLRRTFHDARHREYVTMMHAFHRCAYMNERIEYAKRRTAAETLPSQYLSIISDGMAQNHCHLPHLGNQDTFNDPFPQHLQGVLLHGRKLKIYRTYHTVINSSSSQIHALLLALEEVKRDEGKLPDTIYYQIDGGPENTAKCVLAMCELIVARRLTKKIIISRLPVGHTREDIGSKFGVLWRHIRERHINTPQEYKAHIEHSLSKPNMKCEVEDIHAIPNYKALLDKHIDPKFEGYIYYYVIPLHMSNLT